MPDEPVNLTTHILKEIRDEARRTNERLDSTNERLDSTNQSLYSVNQRIDAMRVELSERITQSELRTATALTELAMTVRDLTSLLRAQSDLRPRVERCEREIVELRARLG
jgi:predicted  nucleic acid-binding Zn-ribbon protein